MSNNDNKYETLAVEFTRIKPLPDPKHGSPCARSSHGLSYIPGGHHTDDDEKRRRSLLFLYGGENIARTPLNDDQTAWIAEFIPEEGEEEGSMWQWRLITPQKEDVCSCPTPRVAHAQAAVGNCVYVFGGRTGVDMGETALNDLWKFDVLSKEWSQIIPLKQTNFADIPQPRSFHKMIAVESDLFVFGGCGAGGRLRDLYRFDTVAETWHSLGESNLLKGRGGPNLLSLKGSHGSPYLAVVAGFTGEENNDGHRFFLSQEGWSGDNDGRWEESLMDCLHALRPRSVCVAGSFPAMNLALIFGGEVNPSDRGHEGAGGFSNDVVVIDGKTGSVAASLKSPVDSDEEIWPQERGWADGSVCNGERCCLYLFGGLTGDDKHPTRLDDMWRCDVIFQETTT